MSEPEPPEPRMCVPPAQPDGRGFREHDGTVVVPSEDPEGGWDTEDEE